MPDENVVAISVGFDTERIPIIGILGPPDSEPKSSQYHIGTFYRNHCEVRVYTPKLGDPSVLVPKNRIILRIDGLERNARRMKDRLLEKIGLPHDDPVEEPLYSAEWVERTLSPHDTLSRELAYFKGRGRKPGLSKPTYLAIA